MPLIFSQVLSLLRRLTCHFALEFDLLSRNSTRFLVWNFINHVGSHWMGGPPPVHGAEMFDNVPRLLLVKVITWEITTLNSLYIYVHTKGKKKKGKIIIYIGESYQVVKKICDLWSWWIFVIVILNTFHDDHMESKVICIDSIYNICLSDKHTVLAI